MNLFADAGNDGSASYRDESFDGIIDNVRLVLSGKYFSKKFRIMFG